MSDNDDGLDDMDLGDDFGLDDLDLDMDSGMGDDLMDVDTSTRSPTSQVLTDGARGFAEAFTDDKLDTALSLGKAAIPKSLSRETDVVVNAYDTVTDELSKQGSKLRLEAKRSLKTFKRFLPEGDDSVVGGILNKVDSLLGDDETRLGSSGPSRAETIATEISTLMGTKSDEELLANQFKEQLDFTRQQQVNEIQATIAVNTERTRKFLFEVSDKFYRSSLDVSLRHLFTAEELLEVTKSGFDTFSTALTAIVKNTALPEVVKIRNTELVGQMMTERAITGITDALFKSGTPVERLVGKATGMIRTYREAATETLASATGNAESLASLAEGGMTLTDLAAMLASDYAKERLGRGIGKLASDNLDINDLTRDIKNAMADPEEAKKLIDANPGMFSDMLSTVVDVAKPKANNFTIAPTDPEEAAYLTNRTTDSINKVIPQLLSKIHSESKVSRELLTILAGGANGSLKSLGITKPEDNELVYSNKASKFVTRTELKDSIVTAVESDAKKTVAATADNVIREFVSGAKEPFEKDELRNIRNATVATILDKGSSSAGLFNHKYFYDQLPPELVAKAKSQNNIFQRRTSADQDMLTSVNNNIEYVLNTASQHRKLAIDLEKRGEVDTAIELGLVTQGPGGVLTSNRTGIKDSIYSGIRDVDVSKAPDKVVDDSEQYKGLSVVDRAKLFAENTKEAAKVKSKELLNAKTKAAKELEEAKGLGSYSYGGYSLDGLKEALAGVVHRGEYVIPQDKLDDIMTSVHSGDTEKILNQVSDIATEVSNKSDKYDVTTNKLTETMSRMLDRETMLPGMVGYSTQDDTKDAVASEVTTIVNNLVSKIDTIAGSGGQAMTIAEPTTNSISNITNANEISTVNATNGIYDMSTNNNAGYTRLVDESVTNTVGPAYDANYATSLADAVVQTNAAVESASGILDGLTTRISLAMTQATTGVMDYARKLTDGTTPPVAEPTTVDSINRTVSTPVGVTTTATDGSSTVTNDDLIADSAKNADDDTVSKLGTLATLVKSVVYDAKDSAIKAVTETVTETVTTAARAISEPTIAGTPSDDTTVTDKLIGDTKESPTLDSVISGAKTKSARLGNYLVDKSGVSDITTEDISQVYNDAVDSATRLISGNPFDEYDLPTDVTVLKDATLGDDDKVILTSLYGRIREHYSKTGYDPEDASLLANTTKAVGASSDELSLHTKYVVALRDDAKNRGLLSAVSRGVNGVKDTIEQLTPVDEDDTFIKAVHRKYGVSKGSATEATDDTTVWSLAKLAKDNAAVGVETAGSNIDKYIKRGKDETRTAGIARTAKSMVSDLTTADKEGTDAPKHSTLYNNVLNTVGSSVDDAKSRVDKYVDRVGDTTYIEALHNKYGKSNEEVFGPMPDTSSVRSLGGLASEIVTTNVNKAVDAFDTSIGHTKDSTRLADIASTVGDKYTKWTAPDSDVYGPPEADTIGSVAGSIVGDVTRGVKSKVDKVIDKDIDTSYVEALHKKYGVPKEEVFGPMPYNDTTKVTSLGSLALDNLKLSISNIMNGEVNLGDRLHMETSAYLRSKRDEYNPDVSSDSMEYVAVWDDLSSEEQNALRYEFFASEEYTAKYITRFPLWLRDLKLIDPGSLGTRAGVVSNVISGLRTKVMGPLTKIRDELMEEGIARLRGTALKELTLEQEVEMRKEYFASDEYREGNITKIDDWYQAQGYRRNGTGIIGRIRKSLSIKNILRKSRALDRKVMGSIYKGVGKAIIKSPVTVAKGALDAAKLGMKLPFMAAHGLADGVVGIATAGSTVSDIAKKVKVATIMKKTAGPLAWTGRVATRVASKPFRMLGGALVDSAVDTVTAAPGLGVLNSAKRPAAIIKTKRLTKDAVRSVKENVDGGFNTFRPEGTNHADILRKAGDYKDPDDFAISDEYKTTTTLDGPTYGQHVDDVAVDKPTTTDLIDQYIQDRDSYQTQYGKGNVIDNYRQVDKYPTVDLGTFAASPSRETNPADPSDKIPAVAATESNAKEYSDDKSTIAGNDAPDNNTNTTLLTKILGVLAVKTSDSQTSIEEVKNAVDNITNADNKSDTTTEEITTVNELTKSTRSTKTANDATTNPTSDADTNKPAPKSGLLKYFIRKDKEEDDEEAKIAKTKAKATKLARFKAMFKKKDIAAGKAPDITDLPEKETSMLSMTTILLGLAAAGAAMGITMTDVKDAVVTVGEGIAKSWGFLKDTLSSIVRGYRYIKQIPDRLGLSFKSILPDMFGGGMSEEDTAKLARLDADLDGKVVVDAAGNPVLDANGDVSRESSGVSNTTAALAVGGGILAAKTYKMTKKVIGVGKVSVDAARKVTSVGKSAVSKVAELAGKAPKTEIPKPKTKSPVKPGLWSRFKSMSKSLAKKVVGADSKVAKLGKFLGSIGKKVVKKLGVRAAAKAMGKLALRAAPVAGLALLAYDAVATARNMYNGDSFSSAASKAIIGVDLFSDDEASSDTPDGIAASGEIGAGAPSNVISITDKLANNRRTTELATISDVPDRGVVNDIVDKTTPTVPMSDNVVPIRPGVSEQLVRPTKDEFNQQVLIDQINASDQDAVTLRPQPQQVHVTTEVTLDEGKSLPELVELASRSVDIQTQMLAVLGDISSKLDRSLSPEAVADAKPPVDNRPTELPRPAMDLRRRKAFN